ncbi:(4Fe-4S)-binding protein [Caloramator sp. E03]|uniref:nucleotide-binding protein n=1 Tax=Caloramator sp. E03 TaxID=2576307 RepID=UPI001110CACF|nr:ATP-binding protein [Caloramator sp. E03]QCX34317.1 (4Fe-4S)-binding protein [Caloramator sp. E03]
MNIAILSGKGGTGKTTVSTSLSVITGANYIDCDVEEPNGFIFLNPSQLKKEEVMVDYPIVDKNKCSLCGECVKVCQFNALVKTKKEIMLFEKLCHGCHACGIVCKNGAITFEKRTIGIIEEGHYGSLICKRGVLNVGEPMAVPVIKKLLKDLPKGLNIIDCAPGTSCNVVNSLQYADYAILVTEPSSFGLHDLKMAVQLVRNFNIPFGVIINKYNTGDERIQKYCKEENIKILGIIPYKREAAEVYSSGKMIINLPEYKKIFEDIVKSLREVFPWS